LTGNAKPENIFLDVWRRHGYAVGLNMKITMMGGVL